MDFQGGGLEGLLGALGGAAGGAGGLEAIWENPMVTSIAFHPSKAEPQFLDSTGAVRDGTFEMSDGTKISYRFYVPPDAAGVKAVIYFFHGNAEVCTALDDVAEMLHSCGAAVLSVDYRGYAWGTGQPSLKKLCPDAEQCFLQSESLLQAAGVGEAKRVMLGRSIGATCAVHLAAKQARRVHGLIVDSGLMSIKQIPTVSMLAPMVFQGQTEKFAMLPEPFDTLGKLPSVGCPVLVMHGDKDEIVPYQQAVQCHEKLATGSKKLQCWVGAGHNDCWALYFEAWKQEVKTLLEQAELKVWTTYLRLNC
ncbi:abhd13 [Symbiodinium necroappetens]|uniref:Abhd13 protein n=1 Tax=Symbiodinium necroappetens TaxID=1628268 RepID=A0A813A2Q5_9DINO|nr:abhd13 [Symbiodinium necroappetens]